jgi:uncharacterized membrane protein YkoI
MTRYWMFTVLLSAGVFAADTRVKMADLPAAVQKTVQEQSKGAVIRGLSKEVENGKTYYEAELKVNGHNQDLLIDPAGTVVEVEDEVALDSVPQAAKTALEKHAGKGKVLSVESVTKDHSLVAYEAKIKTASGKTTEVRVTPEGTPAKEQ